MEYPNSAEEARELLRNSTCDAMDRWTRRRNLIRAAVIIGLCLGAAAVLGIATHRLSSFLAALPLAVMISITGFFPMIYNRSFNRKMRAGVFFEGKSDEEIIAAAREYVDEYRAWEEKQQARQKRQK